MIPPNGLADGTPRFGEQQIRLSPGRKVSPTPGIRKSGSQPPTPEVGSPTKAASTWGFQLSSLANAGMSRRGGASSFVAPVRESWGAELRSSGSVGIAGLAASSSHKALSGESGAAGIDGAPTSNISVARLQADQVGFQPSGEQLPSDDSHLQQEQVQDFLAALKQPGSPSRSVSHGTLLSQGVRSDASPARSAIPPPIMQCRTSTPINARSSANPSSNGNSPTRAPGKAFQEAVARQLQAHAERLVVLQRMLEGSQERLQQLSEHVQRTGMEQLRYIEDLQSSQQQSQLASGQLSKLVGHMQLLL